MKKLLASLVMLSMVLIGFSTIASSVELPTYCTPNPPAECGWVDNSTLCQVTTTVTVAGGSSGGGGTGGSINYAPIIKCKWEYDMYVSIPVQGCQVCQGCIGPQCDHTTNFAHDACPCIPGLQVKPVLNGKVKVGYYAVVTDPNGISTIDHVYADVWHPDGEFKYQIELFPIERLTAKADWAHVLNCHPTLVTYNDEYFGSATLPEQNADILEQLDERLAYLYYGEALIDYCQPGGYYTVGVRAHDSFLLWSDFLWNQYWYIPTSAISIDFGTIDYGSAIVSRPQWVGGDRDMSTPDLPTVKNIGNTPVDLYVWQDDTDFSTTLDQNGIPQWNVEYDVRLSADGADILYDPYENQPGHQGVYFGNLDLCTQEKLDFSIHVKKADAGYTYEGNMCLLAYRAGNPVGTGQWCTPLQWRGNAIGSIPQDIYIPNPDSNGPGV